ncbi:unnamed protein product [Ectocarpus sp. 4 AP-2014]
MPTSPGDGVVSTTTGAPGPPPSDTSSSPVASGSGGTGTSTKKSFASKNLNALTKAPAVQSRGSDRAGEVVRPAYGAGGRLLVLGSKNRDAGGAGGLSTPVPVNTPSLRRENKGQDISVPLVPSGGVGWGAGKVTAPAPAVAELAPAGPARDDRSAPPMAGEGRGGGYGHDNRSAGPPGSSRWPNNDGGGGGGGGGGGRSDPRSYPPPRAPSGRSHFGQRGDGPGGGGRDGSPAGRENGMGAGGYGGQGRSGGGPPGGGGMQGHYLRESDFPLEMGGGASRAEKSPQLRPRGGTGPDTSRGKADPPPSASPSGGSREGQQTRAAAGGGRAGGSGNNSPSPSSHAMAPSSGPRDHDGMPSPLGGGRYGDGGDHYGHHGPPSVPSRLSGRGGSSFGSRLAGYGGTANESARGDYTRGGGGYGHNHHNGDFRSGGGGGGRGWSGGWDGGRGREWDRGRGQPPPHPRERELDWEHRRKWDRDRGPEWDRGPDRGGGGGRSSREWGERENRGAGRGLFNSPSMTGMASPDPYSSLGRMSRRPLEGGQPNVVARPPPSSPAATPSPAPAAGAASSSPRAAQPPTATTVVTETKRPMSEEERKNHAEAVAEEAKAFAERERRLAEKSDEVEKGVALRARMELERLRAEKEKDKDKDQSNARSRIDGQETGSQQQEGADDTEEGKGYEPDEYGRDDPYRRQEDVERERAAQQAAAAALSPAFGPMSSVDRSASAWALAGGAAPPPPPKARPKAVKAVLGRGEEEAVEAGTGARVIQKRQVPPAAVVKVAAAAAAPAAAEKVASESPAVKPAPHTKSRTAEPSKLLLSGKEGANLHAAAAAGGRGKAPPFGGDSGSSVSLQWLTPRREGEAGEAHSHSQRGGQAEHKSGDPSAPPPPRTPPCPAAAQGARSFSSLFAGAGQQQKQKHQHTGAQRPGDAGVEGQMWGGGGGEGGHDHDRDWPEAGRGPPPPPSREHKQIFDHKTGKMRDVEDSDKLRAPSDRPRGPQDARLDGRTPTQQQQQQQQQPRLLQSSGNGNAKSGQHHQSPRQQPSSRGGPSGPPSDSPRTGGRGVNDVAVAAESPETREVGGQAQSLQQQDMRFGGHRSSAAAATPREHESGRGWDQRREFSGGRGRGAGREGRGGWDEPEGGGQGRGRGGWGRGGRGAEGVFVRDGNPGDKKVWERGVQQPVAASGGRGGVNREEAWDRQPKHAPSSRRRASPLDNPPTPDSSPSTPAAPSPATSAASRGGGGGGGGGGLRIAHRPPQPEASPPSPALAATAVSASPKGDSAWGGGKGTTTNTPLPQQQQQQQQHRQRPSSSHESSLVASAGTSLAKGASVSGGSAGTTSGNDAAAAVSLESREAIRARDERERDLAVRQRKSMKMDLNAASAPRDAAGVKQHQQRPKRDGHDKKDAEKARRAERDRVRREKRHDGTERQRNRSEAGVRARREARRKESSERPPRTSGALYRYGSPDLAPDGGSGVSEHVVYVNADIPEGAPDPLQARWNAMAEESDRDHDRDPSRPTRSSAASSTATSSSSSYSKKDPREKHHTHESAPRNTRDRDVLASFPTNPGASGGKDRHSNGVEGGGGTTAKERRDQARNEVRRNQSQQQSTPTSSRARGGGGEGVKGKEGLVSSARADGAGRNARARDYLDRGGGEHGDREKGRGRKAAGGKEGGAAAAAAAALMREQELAKEQEEKAKEEREKLKETRKERKKMKRGGGEEAAAALAGGASGYTGSGVSGSGGGMGMHMGMTPGRVVVDKDDHLGMNVNMSEFDTAEFEVVKSRREVQKERKEQREQEEKAAAQKAMEEAAAARKAAHQAARGQIKAQLELNKAETRKASSLLLFRRAEVKAKAKAAKEAAKATATVATATVASMSEQVRRSDQETSSREKTNASTHEPPAQAATTGSAPVVSVKKQDNGKSPEVTTAVAAAAATQPSAPTSSVPSRAGHSNASPAFPAEPVSSPKAKQSSKSPVVVPPLSPAKTTRPLSPAIQFGSVGADDDAGWSATPKNKGETLVDSAGACVESGRSVADGERSGPPAFGPETTPEVCAPSRNGEAGPSSGASKSRHDAPRPNVPRLSDKSPPLGEGALPEVGVVEPTREVGLNSPGKQQQPASNLSGEKDKQGERNGKREAESAPSDDRGGGKEPESDTRASHPTSSPSGIQQPALNPSSQSTSHGRPPPVAKGLLSSPSLAGSIPAPHTHGSWKPLPVGLASAVLSTGNGVAAVGAGAGGNNKNPHNKNSEWAPGRGGYNGFGAGGSGHGEQQGPGNFGQNNVSTALGATPPVYGFGGPQRGNFGPNSAPAALGVAGWNTASVLNPLQNGGVVGMLGANGGGNSVGGRLRSAPEAFGLGAGPSQVIPRAGYGRLAPRPPAMVLGANGGRDGSPGQPHNRANDPGQTARLATSLAGGMAGGPFAGFVVGHHSPGARQPPIPPGGIPAWTGGFTQAGGGSPGGARMTGVSGGASPPVVQQTPSPKPQYHHQQPHMQQQQQQFYGSFAGGVAPPGSTGLMVPSTQPTIQVAGWQQPASQHVVTSVVATAATPAGNPPPTMAEGGNSGLAAEAAPFIPAGAMGVGSPAIWGMTGPQPQQQPTGVGAPSTGAASVKGVNPIMLTPPTMGGQGVSFGASAVPPGRPTPSPARFATQQGLQQVQRQQHPQQQQPLFQLQQQQQQQQRWLIAGTGGMVPAQCSHPRPRRGAQVSGPRPSQGSPSGGWGAAGKVHSVAVRGTAVPTSTSSRRPTGTAAHGRGSPGRQGNGGGTSGVGTAAQNVGSSTAAAGKRAKKTNSQALYVPKRSTPRGPGSGSNAQPNPGSASVAAVPAAGS